MDNQETATGSLPASRTAPPGLDLLVVVPHLGAGGAQRVVSLLLNHWREKGLRLMLLTLFPMPDAYRLDPGIRREDFLPPSAPAGGRTGLARSYFELESGLDRLRSGPRWQSLVSGMPLALLRAVRRVRALVLTHLVTQRTLLRSPRVTWLRGRLQALEPPAVISFIGSTNIETVLAARGLDTRVLISERNDPAVQRLEPPWEGLRPKVYPLADMVTANSQGAVETMRRFVPAEKLRRVLNPLAVPPCPGGLRARQPRFVCVARLVHQKGIDLLLEAFARVAAGAQGWHLDLLGDGPLRADLARQAQRSGIADRVSFHGHQPDPYPFLCRASVFVLPSRYEGMPNAMLEAMACGLAIVVSDASPGPLELIRDGQTGLVVRAEDPADLARAMDRLVADPALRASLARAASKATEPMRLERVAGDWEQLILELGVDLGRRPGDPPRPGPDPGVR